MHDQVIAQIILRSPEGSSVLESDEPITSENVESRRAEKQVIAEVQGALRDLGFEVVQVSEVTITISGDKELFEDVFDTTLEERSASADADADRERVYEAKQPARIPKKLSSFVSDVVFPVPPEFH